MNKARKHKRVIALSKVDLALKESVNKTEADIVACNLSSDTSLRNSVLKEKTLEIGKSELGFGKNTSGKVKNDTSKVCADNKIMKSKTITHRKSDKNTTKSNRQLSENEKFILEQCPPHFGKI